VVDFSLYIHLPFCSKKCDYCHFYVLPDKEVYKDQLLEGLQKEWSLVMPFTQSGRPVSIYFGGGTPSLFGPDRLRELLNLWECDGEITLEANPETLTRELVQAYADSGINRLSLGVQSLDDALLKTLSRTHNAKKAIDAVCLAAEIIPNISIDLMYDIPTQTKEQWKSTLKKALTLPIQHISLYNLTIEPQTVFYKYREQLQKKVPNENDSRQMYQEAVTTFTDAGFHHYEISAFCQNGKESVHNSGYWTGRPFLGLGPSAFSYWDGARMRNIAHLNKYSRLLEEGKRPIDFQEKLEPDAQARELFVIALRLLRGVSLSEFPLSQKSLSTLDELIRQGLLTRSKDRLHMTPLGILHYDTIASELI